MYVIINSEEFFCTMTSNGDVWLSCSSWFTLQLLYVFYQQLRTYTGCLSYEGTYRDKAKLPFKNSKRNQDTNFDAMEGDSLKWHFKINEDEPTHITFTLCGQSCPPVTILNFTIPTNDTVKYMSNLLHRRLIWKRQSREKCKQLTLKDKKFDWLISRRWNLRLDRKLLL